MAKVVPQNSAIDNNLINCKLREMQELALS